MQLHSDFPRRVTDGKVVGMRRLCYVFMDSRCQLFIHEIGITAKPKYDCVILINKVAYPQMPRMGVRNGRDRPSKRER